MYIVGSVRRQMMCTCFHSITVKFNRECHLLYSSLPDTPVTGPPPPPGPPSTAGIYIVAPIQILCVHASIRIHIIICFPNHIH